MPRSARAGVLPWLLLSSLLFSLPAAAQDVACDHFLGSVQALPGQVFTLSPPDCAYDDDIVLWEGANLPPGMELDPIGGTVTWVPDTWQVGSYPARTIVSTNVRGGSAVWWFDVTVEPTSAPALPPTAASNRRLAVRAFTLGGGRVRFVCESDVARVVRLIARDVRGRVVASPPPRWVARGRSEWQWDAHGAGARVAAGLYWCEWMTSEADLRPRARVLVW